MDCTDCATMGVDIQKQMVQMRKEMPAAPVK